MRRLTTQCQQAVFEVAMELARQDKRLAELTATLPLHFEFEVLPSVETELYSRIQAVKIDYLQPSFAVLMEAAQLSDTGLRLELARSPPATPATATPATATGATEPARSWPW